MNGVLKVTKIENIVKIVSSCIGFMLILLGSSISLADELTDEYINLGVLPYYRAPPYYPKKQVDNGNDGVVELNFMVNKEGYTSDPMVTGSSRKSFEREAVVAASRYRYKPTIINGETVAHFESIRIIFEMQYSTHRASKSFTKLFNSTLELLVSEQTIDKNKIAKLISKLEKKRFQTLASEGRLSYLKFKFAIKFGNFLEHLEAAEHLDMFNGSRDFDFISKEEQHNIKSTLLSLYTKNNQFVEALSVIKGLQKNDLSNNAELEMIKAEINTIYQNDQVVSEIKIHKRGYSSMYIFKNIFSFKDIDGQINKLKFRCRNSFAELAFNAESEYKIPESWGKCHIQIVGDAGTSARLVQF